MLDRAGSVTDAYGPILEYERVGYFELEWQSKGVCLPLEAYLDEDLVRGLRRVPPDIDPDRVFKEGKPSQLRVY